MVKLLFCFLLTFQCWAQKLHHQMIASQGKNVKLSNHLNVAQSVGQSSVTGNFKNNKVIIGQGFIQSFGIAKSVSPNLNAVSMIVYPNPVVDVATFQFSSTIGDTVNCSLFDARGRLVHNKQNQVVQNSFTSDLSQLAEGVYFVKIASSNYTFSTKIMKSK